MAHTLAPLRIYDLLYATTHTPGYSCVGREAIFEKIARTLQRQSVHHVALVGPLGVGKTAAVHGFAEARLTDRFLGLRRVPILELDVRHIITRLERSAQPESLVTFLEQALASLPPCVLVFDKVGELLEALTDAVSVRRVMMALVVGAGRRTIILVTPEKWVALQEAHGSLLQSFAEIVLEEVSTSVCRTIVADRARYIAGRHSVQLQADVPEAIVEFAEQLPGPPQPERALQFFDEVCAAAVLQQHTVVDRGQVETLFAQRIGQPARGVEQLRSTLSSAVIGQPQVVATVAGIIERAWLGLKNPQRPLGSFLFLGPSGVGKTELARVLAHHLYGANAFVRIDMSEYKEAHSVQRLIGAPPGYVGYEAGGQLTSAVLKQPFCLVLLDEIEKADSAVFDVFLQILEDGRLTDGRGTTVDFRKAVIIATSNIGVERLLAGWLRNEDVTSRAWRQRHLMPLLTERFRLEFLNRFEATVVFEPLSEETLQTIAHLELKKIAERLAHHNVEVSIAPAVLAAKIAELHDPRFGARPLKRWLEEAVEATLAREVLAQRRNV